MVTLNVQDEKKGIKTTQLKKKDISRHKDTIFFLFLFSLLSHRTFQIDLIIEPLKRLENGIFVAFPLPLTTSQFGFETRGNKRNSDGSGLGFITFELDFDPFQRFMRFTLTKSL